MTLDFFTGIILSFIEDPFDVIDAIIDDNAHLRNQLNAWRCGRGTNFEDEEHERAIQIVELKYNLQKEKNDLTYTLDVLKKI